MVLKLGCVSFLGGEGVGTSHSEIIAPFQKKTHYVGFDKNSTKLTRKVAEKYLISKKRFFTIVLRKMVEKRPETLPTIQK